MAPRVRDYAAEYRRRVAGTAPGTPERAAARGHRSFADLGSSIASGRVVSVTSAITGRDEQGRATAVTILATDHRGTMRAYTLRQRGDTDAARRTFDRRLRGLGRTMKTSDVAYVPSYPPGTKRDRLMDYYTSEEGAA